jgi:undecaprenyl-diphosphatase
MAVFGFLAYAIARGLGPGKRFEVWYSAVVLVFLVGFSRVFLGVHYPSDVVAGWAAGAFWVLVAIALTEGQGATAVGNPK